MKLKHKLIVEPGKKFKLAHCDPAHAAGHDDQDAASKALAKNVERLADLQYLLYAESKHALLVVLQGVDAAGKDGTIRHVMSGINPQGCRVTGFRVPTPEEAAHDFLWRVHRAVPARGEIGIFNRSHYEDVLVVRVHGLVPKSVWSQRYDQINRFEQGLCENGVTILKFMLHISKGEQKKRFEDRLRDTKKNWKLSPADFAERKYWPDYMEAYEDALTRCSTPHAPWYVIPSDRKWFRNLAVSQIIVETLEELDMEFPPPAFDLSKVVIE